MNTDSRSIRVALTKHKLWLASKAKQGERAVFRGANLPGADFRGVLLIGADFGSANLERADFEEADIRKAVFQEANLKYANLRGADLRGADLQAVDLRGADLIRANLQDTKLEYTNLENVRINKKAIEEIPEKARKTYEQTWYVMDFNSFIMRSAVLRPEYVQAGISLFSFFGTVLRFKMPDTKVKIRVEQYEPKVTLTIDPLRGEREIIAKLLDEFGLVISGKMSPEYFTDDPVLQDEINREMRFASNRIKSQKMALKNRDIHPDNFFAALHAAFEPANPE